MTQTTRCLAAICTAALVVAGCTKGPAPAPVSPPFATPVVTPAEGTAPDSSASNLREQALALMAKGDLPGAIAKWQELTTKEPSADNWNDLSYAQLLAGQYTDAAASARAALMLNPKHPAAQYNLGMALLESGNPSAAMPYLDQSARAQPDRYEPLIGLARAALAQGNAALAAHYLTQARQMKGGEAEAAKLQPALEKLTTDAAAPATCTAQLVDGPVRLCLVQGEKQSELYLITGEGPAQRMAIGATYYLSLEKGSLPGGRVAYWLQSHSAVVDVYRWSAFVVADGKLQQVLFQGGSDMQMLQTSDWIKSFAMPRVVGDELEASHRFEPDPSQSVTMRFRFGSGVLTAHQTFFQEGPRGK